MSLKKSKRYDRKNSFLKDMGNVKKAREYFFTSKNLNLRLLLEERYTWVNEYISDNDFGIEFGAGIGISREFIRNKNYSITDYTDSDWLDIKNIDVLNSGIKDNSQDFVFCSNMIHHVPYPLKFFNEMRRILKPGGLLIIQDVNCSLVLKILILITKKEFFNEEVDIFNKDCIATSEEDPWDGNNSIPNLLFDKEEKFNNHCNYFKIIRHTHSEFLSFINSGGVTSKIFYIPLPMIILRLIINIDKLLTLILPRIFALQKQIVLKKI